MNTIVVFRQSKIKASPPLLDGQPRQPRKKKVPDGLPTSTLSPINPSSPLYFDRVLRTSLAFDINGPRLTIHPEDRHHPSPSSIVINQQPKRTSFHPINVLTMTATHKFTLRKARHEDARAISTLGTSVFAATFGHSCSPEQLQKYLDEEYSDESVARDLANPKKDTTVVVTEEGDEVVGFVMLTMGTTEPCIEKLADIVELQRLYVDSRFHGHGLGGRLVRAVEDGAKERGFQHLWLGVWEENHKAQKVYEKLGFRVVGSHAFDLGGDLQNDYIMLKEL